MIALEKIRLPVQFVKNSLPFKKFEQLSLKRKLLLSFLVVSIIPILLVQTFSYYNSTISMKTKINDLIHFNLVQTAKIIDNTLATYKDLVIQTFSNDSLIEQVKKMNSGTDMERLVAANKIRDELNTISLSKPGVKCISILTASGAVAWYDRETNSGIHNIWSKYTDLTKTEIYQKALKSESYVFSGVTSDLYFGQESHFINIALRFYDWKNIKHAVLGVIVLSFSEDYLYNSCNQQVENTKQIEDFNFIYNHQGEIISFPVKKFLGKQIFPPNRPYLTNGGDRQLIKLTQEAKVLKKRRFTINRFQLAETGWTIVNVIDQNYLFDQMFWMQRLNVIFGVLAILFSILIITYVTSTLSRSANKIVSAMNIARKGELSIQVALDTKDELSMIGSHFNQMMTQIQQLMDDVKVATGRQKEAEIKALVAQINPHFLYNMLDSINWMAIDKEEHEISQMIGSLANILRYSINDSNWVVTLREELEWLKQYIYLQQNHFDQSFESVLDFEETMLDSKIYKLLLQPLIENSIIHGFRGYTTGGILKITGTIEGELLKISITDNGKGISPETLETITRDLQLYHSYSGIGIKNVMNRLRIYYGEIAKLSFTSEVGVGTTVTLLIPII
jgi:two-component system sensor histidine kinase YesM